MDWQRGACPTCNRNSKFYCGACLEIIGNADKVPRMSLPVHIDIIFDDGVRKSTAIHAKLIAPEHVTLHPRQDPFPVFHYQDSVVIYPSSDATTLQELENLTDIKHLIILDSPWRKSRGILLDEKLVHLRRVKLQSPPPYSQFWRYHNSGKGCISTIEAIRYILDEYCELCPPAIATTDLLYFFNLLGSYIRLKRSEDTELPMDEDIKEKYRKMRQRPKEKKVPKVRKEKPIDSEFDINFMRCFNCRKFGHDSKSCQEPCRHCKERGHWHGSCTVRRPTSVPSIQA